MRKPYIWLTPALMLALATCAIAGDHTTYIRPIEVTLPALGVTQVVLINLVGPVTVETAPDESVHLEVLVHAGGPDQAFAKTLAGQLDFQTQQTGGQLRITGVYPLDHFRDYGYPNMKSILGIHGTDSNEYAGKKVFIRTVGSEKAVELWAEVRLKLPARMALVVRNTYGNVELRGTGGAAPEGSVDGFTDVGDITVYRPAWATVKLQSDYGKLEFTDGFGAAKDISLNTNVGGTYLDLPSDAQAKIIAHKDLGFLHNDLSTANFSKNSDGDSVLQLGQGGGPVVHIEMSVGSLHLNKVGS
ncbi:MAG TPA: hypothetical protein VN690_03590 [Terriglobales bacterium]|nr:hypothetical protein [Terriglobales bacterium]